MFEALTARLRRHTEDTPLLGNYERRCKFLKQQNRDGSGMEQIHRIESKFVADLTEINMSQVFERSRSRYRTKKRCNDMREERVGLAKEADAAYIEYIASVAPSDLYV